MASSGKVYLPGGRLPDVGEILKTRSGSHFRRLIGGAKAKGGGDHGPAAARDAFYREIARLVLTAKRGGLLTAEDLPPSAQPKTVELPSWL